MEIEASRRLSVEPHHWAVVIVLVSILVFVIGLIALDRTYLNFDVETDFLGSFMPEAQRFMAAEPLLLQFHPPLYPAVLAAVRLLVGDWFVAGLVVSFVSAAVALVCGYGAIARLFGPWIGCGALIGLAASKTFISHAASATSDAFFLALFLTSLWLALKAVRAPTGWLWSTCGLVIGWGVLARSNGLTLLLLSVMPWMACTDLRRKVTNSALVLAGVTLPLAVWLAYASATGSAFWPSSNYVNLALTYFSPSGDRISGDAFRLVESRFANLTEVLLHDPAHMVRTYVADLKTLVSARIPYLLEFPFPYLFLPGLLLLFARSCDRIVLMVLAVVSVQVALVNFKAFDSRFYMFLIPFLGAGVGEVLRRVVADARPLALKATLTTALLAGVLFAGVKAHTEAVASLHRDDAELAEAVPAARQAITNPARIVARKRHIAFYTAQTEFVSFPSAQTETELRGFLAQQASLGPVYLYYGAMEMRYRPQLADILTGETPPQWLDLIARSSEPGRWYLYRFRAGGGP